MTQGNPCGQRRRHIFASFLNGPAIDFRNPPRDEIRTVGPRKRFKQCGDSEVMISVVDQSTMFQVIESDPIMDCVDLDSSVPDWLIEHPGLLALFQELGIDYCCGGKSLRTACRKFACHRSRRPIVGTK
jgi:hypothetical protein